MVKELELEAKERQQKAAQATNEKLYGKATLPQTFGEASRIVNTYLESDPQPEPTRSRPTTHTTTATSHSSAKAKTKAAPKDKHDGEAAEKAAKLLGTNRDYVSKVKKLETLDRTDLLEIDENLRRYDLTAWEQSQHIERREVLLKKRGQRAKANDNRHTSRGVTVTPLKTTADLADEAGMSKRTYKRRAAVGRDIAEATADILNSITDLEACDLPDSPKQLEYLAKLEDKTLQATIAERVAHGAAKDVFEASRQLKKARLAEELEYRGTSVAVIRPTFQPHRRLMAFRQPSLFC